MSAQTVAQEKNANLEGLVKATQRVRTHRERSTLLAVPYQGALASQPSLTAPEPCLRSATILEQQPKLCNSRLLQAYLLITGMILEGARY